MQTSSSPNPFRPTLLRRSTSLLVAGLATLAFVTPGCGGGDDDTASKSSGDRPESSTTEKSSGDGNGIASGILDRASTSAKFGDDSGFDDAVAECVGSSVIDSLGEEQAEAMSNAEVSEYTDEELTALADAFDECVPGELIAESMTVSFYESAGATTEPSIETVQCVADALDGRTGQVVKEGAKADAGGFPALTLAVMDGCVPPEDVAALLKTAFLDAGLTEAQADCTATALQGQISVSDLAVAGLSDDNPELEAKVQQAAQACA